MLRVEEGSANPHVAFFYFSFFWVCGDKKDIVRGRRKILNGFVFDVFVSYGVENGSGRLKKPCISFYFSFASFALCNTCEHRHIRATEKEMVWEAPRFSKNLAGPRLYLLV